MAELKVADTKLGKLRWKDPDKLKVEDPLGLEGLTLTKTIKANNAGDAKAIFRNRYNIAPGVNLDVRAEKDEGRGGKVNFTVRIALNKGGAIKKYAKGGGIRKVRHD
jgi:hypothetical protein